MGKGQKRTRSKPRDLTMAGGSAVDIRKRPPGHPIATYIRPRLLLGGTFDALDSRLLHGQGVTHVLNISKERYELKSEYQTLKLAIDDEVGEGIREYFAETSKLIDEVLNGAGMAANKVLVHCEFGVSRSAVIVAAYLMWAEKLNPVEVLKGMRQQRPVCMVCPNHCFLRALVAWGVACGQEEVPLEHLLRVTRELENDKAPDKEAWIEIPAGDDEADKTREWPDDVRLRKNEIAEDILTLHCPACSQAFLDFSNCFALWCCCCDTAFCAYCQYNCRNEYNDAHNHVMRCKYNIAPRRSIFADFEVFEMAQNLRRVREIRNYVAAIEDPAMQAMVLRCIRQDCVDLGITVRIRGGAQNAPAPDVSRQRSEQMDADAPGAAH